MISRLSKIFTKFIKPTSSITLFNNYLSFRKNIHSFGSVIQRRYFLTQHSTFIPGNYKMSFTCDVCKLRAAKQFSKNSYHNGVVIIRCDNCQNLHLVADNLKWFKDDKTNIEKIMKEKNNDFKLIQSPLSSVFDFTPDQIQ